MSSTNEVAYKLWQQRGCPDGSADQDWYNAEKLLTKPSNEVCATNSNCKATKPSSEVCIKNSECTNSKNTQCASQSSTNTPNTNTSAKSKKEAKKQAKKQQTKSQSPQKTESQKTESPLKQDSVTAQVQTRVTDKQKALAFKEGAKKGQDLSGLEDMGGVHFFHVALENCEGDWELVEKAMDGANTPVDERAEDRKGGAQLIGKAFLSASAERLCIYVHVPDNLTSFVAIEDWLDVLCKMSYATVIQAPCKSHGEDGGLFAKAEVLKLPYVPLKDLSAASAPVEIFPLKLRDSAIGAGFAFLRSKGLVPENDDSSELEIEDGYEW